MANLLTLSKSLEKYLRQYLFDLKTYFLSEYENLMDL